MAGTVCNLRFVPYMAIDPGQAAILTPSDYFFARDGITAESANNREQIIVADVELDLLDEQRVNGSVIPLQGLIKDACHNVVHFSDYKGQRPIEVEKMLRGCFEICCVPLRASTQDFKSLADKLPASGPVTGIPTQLSCFSS